MHGKKRKKGRTGGCDVLHFSARRRYPLAMARERIFWRQEEKRSLS